MSDLFTVTTAATDLALLSLAELRRATGAADGQEADLVTLGARVAAVIARACKIAADGATAPTLRLETVADTFELDYSRPDLILSRRPIISVVSVVENGVTLTADDYRADAGAGLLRRRLDGRSWSWPPCFEIVVSYAAGWATVPEDLKLAAAKTATMIWAESGPSPRDPNLKRVRTEGIDEVEYWVPPASDSLLSAEILDLLRPYTNETIG